MFDSKTNLMAAALAAAALAGWCPVVRAADEKPADGDKLDVKSLNLKLEMIEFVGDLKHSRSYKDEDLDKALASFKGKGVKTPANSGEMLNRMAVAMAAVDKEFKAGWEPFSAGKYEDSLRVWKDQLNLAREETSYKMALTRYFLGESYRLTNQRLESIFEYRSLALKMPTMFSPAAMGRYMAGKVFEDLNRKIRATEEWSEFAKNYSTADEKLIAEVEAKLKDWTKQYGSMGAIIDGAAEQMKEVKGDLSDKQDSSKPIQVKQEKIVGLLEDLITTLEEKQKEKDGGGGGGGGSGDGQGQGDGPPNGNGKPNSPATQSKAPDGKTAGVGELKSGQNVRADGGWGQLPPRERERILAAIRIQFPDRYNAIVKEYLKSVSETQSGGTNPR